MKELAAANTERFTVNIPTEKVFTFIVAEDVLPKILKKYLFIPAVTSSTVHQGNWETPGSYRTVHFANGTTLREELNHFDQPEFFAYTVSNFSGFQKHFASHGTGQWWFEQDGEVSHVTWTYTFYAKSRFRHFLLRLSMKFAFRTYMKRSIKLIKAQLENDK